MDAVKPNWSGEAHLPHTIRLPVQIANALYGVGSGRREIVIRRQDETIPSLIIEWMQGDPRYRTWFLQEVTPAKEATQPDPEPKAEPVPIEPEAVEEDDKPKRGRRKRAADGDN